MSTQVLSVGCPEGAVTVPVIVAPGWMTALMPVTACPAARWSWLSDPWFAWPW
jgi:hypothetical protein